MGKLMGAYDSDELDRPDLNKCPDCGCFFAGENCPLCNKPCPEEFRAGNRKPPKKVKKRNASNRTVTFIEWYHSWWFIILMLIFMPFVGVILLLTSPHKKAVKIGVASVAIVYGIVTTVGIGNIVTKITNIWNKPVDTSLSRDEYIAECVDVDAEEYYRSVGQYEDKFVSVELKVKEKIVDSDGYYKGDKYCTYYVCTDNSGGEFKILIRDCIQDGSRNLIAGDVVTVYGEGAGEITIWDMEYDSYSAPCINVAFIEEQKKSLTFNKSSSFILWH
ncbi:MAG: hypothetical protein IJ499_05325 [Clostridia bacterium]|nr:hypothetical protein [Clostridia bacterium]